MPKIEVGGRRRKREGGRAPQRRIAQWIKGGSEGVREKRIERRGRRLLIFELVLFLIFGVTNLREIEERERERRRDY